MNAINTTENQPTVRNHIICRFCGREGRSRRSHRDCGMNPTSVIVSTPVTPVICLACEREEHTRTNHTNCIGEMNTLCLPCGACMWIAQRKISSSVSTPRFQMCCAAGQAILKPLSTFPEIIVNLIKRNNAQSKEFIKHMRTYNSALSFTSMNADLDRRYANNQHGTYAFQIHGSSRDLQSLRLSNKNKDYRLG